MFSLENIPSTLHHSVNLSLEHFNDALQKHNLTLPNHPQLINSLPQVFACSEFVAQSCARHPQLLFNLIENEHLFKQSIREHYPDLLKSYTFNNEAGLMKILRQFRQQQMVRIAWRDLANWSDLDETLADLTALAESCIQFTLDYLYQQACDKRGTPVLNDGTPQNLVILGMGKLGAWELNYSSDIDLIFAYQQEGQLNDRKETSYSEFFSKIARQLVKILDEITADGFVFRTDIRLRPFGDSGPIVMTFDGLENYYQTQAREWERYAMVKVRPVAGDKQGGKGFMQLIKPFVYRRYLDYGALDEIRQLKLQITQELQRKDRMDNIKLGPGGIREIEFIGQAFQLIRGGQEFDLQERRIQVILKLLGEKNLLPLNDSEQLQSSYQFLRRVENHIQQHQDKQAHDLPTKAHEQAILAYSMGYADWQSFIAVLKPIREKVHAVFSDVFSINTPDTEISTSESIWMGHAHEEICLNQLAEMGYKKVEKTLDLLNSFRESSAIKRLTSKGMTALNKLMPQLIDLLATQTNAYQTLERVCGLFEVLAGRNVYLALLAENPPALHQLTTLSSASPWICEYIAQYPFLFDELLDTRSLYEPLEKSVLQQQLQQQLSSIANNDIEQLMIALRQFKQVNVLRVAAADIMGKISLMVVSDYLSYIAEVILEQAVAISWHILTEKHGLPENTSQENTRFGILGFGKLGGLELSYSSDLDLIFIADYDNANALTDGRKQVSNTQFYNSLGQKIRSLLNTQLLSGMLYEVDMRLRPSGEAGLLVTPMSSYEDYLKNTAWTWEHQALVRARFVTGDVETEKKYTLIREHILYTPRNIETLQQEVREMREKMRDNLDTSNHEWFNLKQGVGGITDIEFIIQFLILAHAEKHPDLSHFTDNMRLTDTLHTYNILSSEQADCIKIAYCHFRNSGHKEALQNHKAIIPQDEMRDLRQQISDIWQQIMQAS